jgi:hypothetical protein
MARLVLLDPGQDFTAVFFPEQIEILGNETLARIFTAVFVSRTNRIPGEI